MRRLRTHVDALLIGPGTLRAERVGGSVPEAMVAARRARGLPDQPLTVTLSSTLDLPDTPFLRGPGRSIVFTVDGASDSGLEDRATVIRCGAGRVDLARALGILRSDWGVRLLLTESGPNVNEQLVRLGLLDELFWTIAPRLAGGSGIGLMWSPTPAEALLCDLELLSLAEHQGELYSRYRVKRRVDDTSTG
jgi:riboflavin biosynthesis pyrimidine reductase